MIDRPRLTPATAAEPGTQAVGWRGFRAALDSGFVLLDAAMGTRLMGLGLRPESDDPCLWNLAAPEAVCAIHRRDLAAGAAAVVTNTFGANRHWLGRLGRGSAGEVAAINGAAVALARRETAPGRFVIGGLGPTAADGEAVAEQARALVAAGVDALLFETHRLDQAEAALQQLGGIAGPGLAVLVSLIAWPDPADGAIERLSAAGIAALGANCQNGMEAALAVAERLRRSTPLPLFVKPAAGLPGAPSDGPQAFAGGVPRLRALAPVLVGGCCGTSEAHLAAIREAWYDALVEDCSGTAPRPASEGSDGCRSPDP